MADLMGRGQQDLRHAEADDGDLPDIEQPDPEQNRSGQRRQAAARIMACQPLHRFPGDESEAKQIEPETGQ